MTSPGDMSEYQAMAENALRTSRATGTRRVVSNRGPDHARAVTRVMIASAERSLSFVCGRLSPEVFELETMREFLERPGTRMNVLVDDEPDPTAIAGLSAYMAGRDPRLNVRRLATAQKIHFGIADGRDVRIETDVALRKATVVFGDPDMARGASARFDALWEAGSPVHPAQDVKTDA